MIVFTVLGAKPLEKPIDINQASQVELMQLPGIGEVRVKAIMTYRTKRQFKRIADIIKVKGIGRRLFKKLQPYIVVAPAVSTNTKVIQ
ncbi:MAG: helix-hairpin-helix domain-containing protein [Deltaproteobacteria bacterium]|nr:helix-hairpin-helix domain-containing protein [Deltaproteobacteria bacterium]